jgi:hypothetical protein
MGMEIDPELESIADTIVKQGFQVPAILLLQGLKPLSGCIAHLAEGVAAIPVLEKGVYSSGVLGKLFQISTDRQRIECLLQRIEVLSGS